MLTNLTKEEEIQYIKKIKDGDKEYLEKFLRINQGLIISIAKKYAFISEILPDLIMEGNLGFIKSIDKYDIKKNTKFSTYSYFWIRKYILNSIVNQFQSIKAPEYVWALKKKYNDYISSFKLGNNRKPIDEEIAKELGISQELFSKIKNYFAYSKSSSSIKTKEDDFVDTFDILEIDNTGEKISKLITDEEILNRIFQKFKENEKRAKVDLWLKILKMYFGLNGQKQYSYKEISKYFNISRQRVCQIIKTTVEKLKKEYKEMKNEGII